MKKKAFSLILTLTITLTFKPKPSTWYSVANKGEGYCVSPKIVLLIK